ncbi:hypothetical protein [Roseiflexus castenholzii]|jgi:hypothetical protein|uniref:Uncharacterized protein n=1 Tax=Roseiflexus castenholzii (strain DSM 13941 / HLO8) TaxID=383372 RepID=A7NHN3_ROSCS|nr:hypothetical protein [Roseiflexus castenholzii]ABU56980.1 conserved hypothetical protein [Roseiflexus castenholzii DSM 13941]
MLYMRVATVALIYALLTIPVAAQEQGFGLTLTLRPGYGGAYRLGEWFPVIVEVANDGRDLRGMLEWSFPGSPGQPVFRHEIDLPRGSRKRVTLDVFAQGFARNGQVRLIENGNVVLEQIIGIDAVEIDRFLVLVVGSDPTLLTSLSAMSVSGTSGTVVRHVSPDDLPSQPLVLRGVNAIFIHDVDTAALSMDQRAALRDWVHLGGQLVVGGGINGERAAAGLADMLPVETTRTLDQGDLSLLEQLTGAPPAPATGPVLAVRPRSGAEALPVDAPLIYRSRLGSGVVVFSAFDLGLLRGWSAEPRLWSRVLQPVPLFIPGFDARVNQISMMQDALRLPAIQLPSATMLAVFLMVYILAAGPVNYLALRRLRRLEWAWVTIPLTVAVFTVGVFLAGFGLRGGQAQLLQVAIVQGSEGEPRGVATAYLALFSPIRGSYTLRFPANHLVSETRGFDDFTARPVLATSDDTGVTVPDLLVDVASVRTLVAEGPTMPPVQVQSMVRLDGADPQGEVRNVGSVTLEQAIVVHQGRYLELGTLAPGARAAFDFNGPRGSFPFGVAIGDDRVFNRRQILFRLFNSSSRIAPLSGRSPLDEEGIYVLGWGASSTLPVEMNGRTAAQEGLTLFVIRLRTT